MFFPVYFEMNSAINGVLNRLNRFRIRSELVHWKPMPPTLILMENQFYTPIYCPDSMHEIIMKIIRIYYTERPVFTPCPIKRGVYMGV